MPDLIDLVRLGFHGVALAVLLLGYRLLKTVVEARVREGKEASDFSVILKNIRTFMVLSLCFFLAGAAMEIWRLGLAPVNQISLVLSPSEMPETDIAMPEIVAEKTYTLGKEPINIDVRPGDRLFFRVESLCKVINTKNQQLGLLTARLGEGNSEQGF